MEDVTRAMPGSKIPFNINVDGLGDDLFLSDASVTLKARFYAHRVREWNEQLPETVEYTKAQMVADHAGDCDDYVCLVDTTGLGYGVLTGIIEVTYPSGNGTATERMMVRSDVTLYEKGM